MNKQIVAGAVIVAGVLVAVAGYRYAYRQPPVRIQGQIEAQTYSVTSKVPGRLGEVRVRKGDQVKRGDAIFTLTSPELEAKLHQAQAQAGAAAALADEANNGARKQQIAAARDMWQQAQSAATLYATTYRRINNLYQAGVVAQQKRDEAYTQWQAGQLKASAAEQQYRMAEEGAREEEKRAAQAKLQMANGAVAEVDAYHADLIAVSPANGEVSQVLLQGGELAPSGFPVVTLTDMQDAWALLHVREDQLAAFQPGKTFAAQVPALGQQPIRFKVTHVAVMGDFATWRATDSQQGFDLRTFEVEARPEAPVANLRVGMTVVVELPDA